MARKQLEDPSDEMLTQIRSTAEAEFNVKASGAEPEFVEIEGVKYFRERPPSNDPNKPQDAPQGKSLVVINLAPHAKEIRIDNRIYAHGFAYWVDDEALPTFNEIMDRTWFHERATGGANSSMIGAHNTHLGANGAVGRSIGVAGRPGF